MYLKDTIIKEKLDIYIYILIMLTQVKRNIPSKEKYYETVKKTFLEMKII